MIVSLGSFCKWLAATPLSEAIQTTKWVIPALQTIHILAIAVVFSSAVIVDLRLWRLVDRHVSLTEVAGRFLPPIWPVLAVLLTTGSLLIIGEPQRSLQNSSFYIKMALLACAIVVTAGLQRTIARDAGFWEATPGRRAAGRVLAVLSIAIWSGILFAGRWIAYTQVG